MLAVGSGCTSPSKVSRDTESSSGALHGDFGELQVAATMAVGEENIAELSAAPVQNGARTQPLRGVAFEGRAGSYVKIEVEPVDDEVVADATRPQALLVGTRDGRPYVVAHGAGAARGILWFQLLRSGTHYVVAKDAPRSRIRTRVTEVLAPRSAARADAPLAINEWRAPST